jgi:L-asparaginase
MSEGSSRGGVTVIITGGTIDAQYNFLRSKVDYGDTHVDKMLMQGRARVNVHLAPLMLVNSNEISDEQRQQILERCESAKTNRIIITHGTDTMIETATFLGKNVTGKTIVLVGSMIPYMFKESDALFNLGAAITAVQLLSEGVFITMNGKVFKWDNVKKNFEIGEFQTAD